MRLPDFSPEAQQDLTQIHDYIAQDSPDAALRLIVSLEQHCQTIAENPMIGQSRPELLHALRSFAAGSYIIFYRPTDDGIYILRVIHGARDIGTLF
ncbi:MAG: type II toxin-antitoxin system RelE/ParE family toxin [Chloroflexi bacterium]|nr:type II toxin-antitoxin system RelE/ParE family toxin [Chloroflexota bacterium]